jgi:hypothetical protein
MSDTPTYSGKNHWPGPDYPQSYWQQRCEAAEAYISLNPGDPDVTPAEWAAYQEWQAIRAERDD